MNATSDDDSKRLVLVGEVYGIYLEEDGDILMGVLPGYMDYYSQDQIKELNLWLALHVGVAFPPSRPYSESNKWRIS